MPGRSYTGNGYKYGYQGSEKDNEVTGVNQSHITTYFREGDTRLGRWWSIDPVTQPWQGSYVLMDNTPTYFNDIDGDIKDPYKRHVNRMYRIAKRQILRDNKKFHPAFIDKYNRIITQKTLDLAKSRQDLFDSDPNKYSHIGNEYERLINDLRHSLDRNGPSSSGSWASIVNATRAQYTSNDLFRLNYNSNSATIIPLGSGRINSSENLTTTKNGSQISSLNGPMRFQSSTYKVTTGDVIQLSLSRIQPGYGIINPPNPNDFTQQPNGSFLGASSVAPFEFMVRITYKN